MVDSHFNLFKVKYFCSAFFWTMQGLNLHSVNILEQLEFPSLFIE